MRDLADLRQDPALPYGTSELDLHRRYVGTTAASRHAAEVRVATLCSWAMRRPRYASHLEAIASDDPAVDPVLDRMLDDAERHEPAILSPAAYDAAHAEASDGSAPDPHRMLFNDNTHKGCGIHLRERLRASSAPFTADIRWRDGTLTPLGTHASTAKAALNTAMDAIDREYDEDGERWDGLS